MILYSPIKGGGGEVMQITYQKKDGCVFQRLRNTMIPYKIGDETSMGWKVLNIEYEYNDKFYSENEYHTLIRNAKQKTIKNRHTRDLCVVEFKKFMYYFMAALVIKFITILLGV
jgi:hypothetical protein